MSEPVLTAWPGGALPPTNAEQYATVEAYLQRAFDPGLAVEDRVSAAASVEIEMRKLRERLLAV